MVRFLLALFILLPFTGYSAPLNLNPDKTHAVVPVIKDFKHWFGTIEYGWVYYLGEKQIAGFEAELHLKFVKKKLAYAIVIFGPTGLNQDNCMKRYKHVIKTLNKKYGHYKFAKQTKDPIVDDLVVMSPCHAFRIGAYELKTYWDYNGLKITSSLIGDDEGYYIETEYYFNKINPQYDNVLKSTL